jgi:hypothetical protein
MGGNNNNKKYQSILAEGLILREILLTDDVFDLDI